MSTVYDCSQTDSRTAGLAAAKNALKAGRLVVLPTDTLYGLAADAFDSEAVTSLLRAKGRGRDMPVPVLVGSWNTIDGLVYSVRPQARDLIRAFWPGGLSLVVEQAPSLAWDLGDTRGTVMLRMPLHPVALELLRDVGPLAVSSANISGRPPATTVEEAPRSARRICQRVSRRGQGRTRRCFHDRRPDRQFTAYLASGCRLGRIHRRGIGHQSGKSRRGSFVTMVGAGGERAGNPRIGDRISVSLPRQTPRSRLLRWPNSSVSATDFNSSRARTSPAPRYWLPWVRP